MIDNIGPGSNDYGRSHVTKITFDLFQQADERARETGKELESLSREDLIIYLTRKLNDVSAQLNACKKSFHIAQQDLETASAALVLPNAKDERTPAPGGPIDPLVGQG